MDYSILKKSLKMVSAFAENSHAINTVNEFFTIHTRNMNMLSDYVTEYNDDFVKELLESIPQLSMMEVQEYIDNDRGNKTNYQGGGILSFLHLLIVKKGVTSEDEAFEKIKFIANRNNTIHMILENSGF